MSTYVENLRRQAVPILHKDVADTTSLKLFVLRDRQRVVMDDNLVSQDILDKESAGHVKTGTASDSPVLSRFGA